MSRPRITCATTLLFATAACAQTFATAAGAQTTLQPAPSRQAPSVSPLNKPAAKGTISGRITSGKTPLPGVSISAANSITGRKYATSTDVDGSFEVPVPAFGRYVVRADFSGFSPQTREVVVNAAAPQQRADIDLPLLSRVQQAPDASQSAAAAVAGAMAGSQNGRGIRNLSVQASDASAEAATVMTGNAPNSTSGGFPSANSDLATESVSVSGSMGQVTPGLNEDDIRERVEEFRRNGGQGGANTGPSAVIGGAGSPGGGFGGPFGGGPIMFGGGGGRGGRGGGRGRFDFNQPHGTLWYGLGNAALDAAPYNLNGGQAIKPDYNRNTFGAILGGPLKIPHITDGKRDFFFANWIGSRNTNPFDAFSIVPTAAERSGNFSGVTDRSGNPVVVRDPLTGEPFPGNIIPQDRISPTAQALLNFVPLPNESTSPNNGQNFHGVFSGTNDTDNINARWIHNFGDSSGGPMMMGPFGGGGGGGRRAHNNINFGFSYQRGNNDLLNVFPQLGGTSESHNASFTGGYSFSRGHLNINVRTGFSFGHNQTFDLFTGNNIESALGIPNVSPNPGDFGLPRISLTNFGGLNETAPQDIDNKAFNVSPTFRYSRGKHTLSWGGDYHRNFFTVQTGGNARGSFVFTGLYTGFDLADFLLGTAQQTSIQYLTQGAYDFRGNNYSLFLQDDWRWRSNLSVNVGLRYEYAGPYYELHNRLANLIPNATFTSVAVKEAVSGSSLINPDRNNWAPRLGIAWKPMSKTVVRAGYGVNYNLGQYQTIAQQLGLQPPFAFTQTNVVRTPTVADALTFQTAFSSSNLLTNNFAVNPDYVLGYVQNWNMDIQRDLPAGVVMNLTYQGAKGTHLDLQRAPNRNADGTLRIAGVDPFIFEDSLADSIYHGGSVRVRKRMKNGLSFGGTYTYSKSIDNASSIGGGAVVVAQNDRDLAAERGLSSFDQRHRLTADWYYELPFGESKWLLHGNSWYDHILSNTQWNGSVTLATGLPFTPRVLGSITDVATGVNGTLRADYTGAPISGPQNVDEWFNTAAFTLPLPGQFGTAGRNSIEGPGTFSLNSSISKQIQLGEGLRRLEFRLSANNILNHPNFVGIDSVVNSPTFGQVTSIASMRTVQFTTRFTF